MLLDNHFKRERLIEADNTKSILSILESKPVTHMILDMQLTDANILEILPQIKEKYPQVPVLIFTMSSEDIYGARMIQMGADGFLSKQSDESEVVKAIDLFLQGRKYISSHLQDIMNNRKQQKENPISSLSERELSVLSRLLKGESVKEISFNLELKATTVATYKARIFEKLSVSNIIELRNVTELYEFHIS